MSHEVSEYLATLDDGVRVRIAALYEEALALVPEAEEGVSYGMPSLMYRGKGLLSVMSTKQHIGVYPHGNLGEFTDAVTAAGLGSTKGSIHVRDGETLPAGLLASLLWRRTGQIDAAAH